MEHHANSHPYGSEFRHYAPERHSGGIRAQFFFIFTRVVICNIFIPAKGDYEMHVLHCAISQTRVFISTFEHLVLGFCVGGDEKRQPLQKYRKGWIRRDTFIFISNCVWVIFFQRDQGHPLLRTVDHTNQEARYLHFVTSPYGQL